MLKAVPQDLSLLATHSLDTREVAHVPSQQPAVFDAIGQQPRARGGKRPSAWGTKEDRIEVRF